MTWWQNTALPCHRLNHWCHSHPHLLGGESYWIWPMWCKQCHAPALLCAHPCSAAAHAGWPQCLYIPWPHMGIVKPTVFPCARSLRYGCICRIRWFLLESYVCFTTTSLDTVDMHLLLRLSTTCRYQTTATGWQCCDTGQNDAISKIELFPSSNLSSKDPNCKNGIQLFLQTCEKISVYCVINWHSKVLGVKQTVECYFTRLDF